ncbi:MAG: hypothetical protein WEB87_02355 [Bacteriovoracaceae bacterium]
MAKNDKKLRVVNLEDLQSETSSADHKARTEEENVDAKVSISELDRVKRTPPTIKSPAPSKQGEPLLDKRVQRAKDINARGREGKEQTLNYLTNKYRFDRKRLRYSTLWLTAAVFAAGYLFEPMEFDEPVTLDNIGTYITQGIFGVLFALHALFDRIYPLICAAILFTRPLKIYTDTMIQIFYEGLAVPSEIFSIGKPRRNRALWKDIKEINFKSRYGVPFVQLMDKSGRLLGEMRLDVDNLKEMYSILDTYAPEDHPLRKLLK